MKVKKKNSNSAVNTTVVIPCEITSQRLCLLACVNFWTSLKETEAMKNVILIFTY